VDALILALGWKNTEVDEEERIDGATDQWYVIVTRTYEVGWGLRATAATALGNIGSFQAVEPLISALQDENSYVREAAANALGMLGDKRAIEPLMGLIKDKSDSVKQAVVAALKRLT
jgi:HEAT repeat protein